MGGGDPGHDRLVFGGGGARGGSDLDRLPLRYAVERHVAGTIFDLDPVDTVGEPDVGPLPFEDQVGCSAVGMIKRQPDREIGAFRHFEAKRPEVGQAFVVAGWRAGAIDIRHPDRAGVDDEIFVELAGIAEAMAGRAVVDRHLGIPVHLIDATGLDPGATP